MIAMSVLKTLLGLAPWFVFALLANRTFDRAVAVAALVAMLIASVEVVRSLARRKTPKILEGTAVFVFAAIAVIGFFGSVETDRFLADYGQPIASLILAGVIFVLLPVMPFTEQYARESVPQQYWHLPLFRSINRRISAVWGFAIAAIGLSQVLATLLEHHGLDSHHTWELVLNWVVPIVAITWAVKYTKQQSKSADDKAPDEADPQGAGQMR
jgi:hypothetical protein